MCSSDLTLLMSPLQGADRITYALAQGPISIGGFAVKGAARGVQKNHLHVGRIAGGAIVERELPSTFNKKTSIALSLKKEDFTTASRVSKAINELMKDVIAVPADGRTINIKVPEFFKGNTAAFMTRIESLEVQPDMTAKVVVDERTGTVVIGENVRISTVAVAHGNLFVNIRETPVASQPQPLSPQGQTAVLPRTRVGAEEGKDKLLVIPSGIGISDVVNALNAIGVSPRDLIAILQAIKASGALHADLEII